MVRQRAIHRMGTVALLSLLWLLAGCQPMVEPAGAAADDSGLQIHLFDAGIQGSVSATYDEMWPLIEALEPATSYATLSESDMVGYDWDHQLITFNRAIQERRESDPSFLGEVQPFLVTLDGEKLFGGLTLFRYSARRVDYPVLYVLEPRDLPGASFEDVVIVALRPTHDMQTGMEGAATRIPQLTDEQNDAIRGRLQERGLLVEP